MKLETFFEKFDQFADAPDAVEKMRELVLQLAVTGKLVAQDGRDKPASSLVQSAEAERAKLVAARKIKARPTAPVEGDEQPYELPSSWAWARLSDVGYELGQKVPDKRFTYIDVGGIDSDKGRISDRVEQLEPGDAPSRARKLVTRGTVIYSTVRPYLLNIAIVDQDFEPEPIASTAFGILHPFEGINNRYLFYWLRSAPFTAYVQAGMKGMAYPAINDEKFYSGPIALPPLAEQKRIVAKVDELMALCDRLEAQQQEREIRRGELARASLVRFADAPTPANLQLLFHPSYAIPPADLRKSILTLAVQGKLVPQDPDDEPAEQLINRVSSALPNKKSQNPFIGKIEGSITDESEYELPYGWAWLPLGHLGIWATGCGFPTQYQGEPNKEFLFCKVSDMNLPGNEVEIHQTVHTIDAEVMQKIRARANPVGTVIFPKIGGAIATHKRRLVIKPTIIDNNCSGIQPIGLTDERWLLLFMRNLDLTKYQSGTSVPAVSQGSLDPIRIGLPPLAEQRRIVAKVEQLMALVDQLEEHLASSRTLAAQLTEAVVAELTAA
jgi:type I restriction enzyme S subunit